VLSNQQLALEATVTSSLQAMTVGNKNTQVDMVDFVVVWVVAKKWSQRREVGRFKYRKIQSKIMGIAFQLKF
jgi:hypothetical protein